MSKLFILLSFLLLSGFSHGQVSTPSWINDARREMEYPASTFYTGFAVVVVRANEGVDAATERATQIAKGELAEKIRVRIASQTTLGRQSSMVGTNEQFSEQFSSAVQTEARAEIANVRVQTYHDRQNREVYAFAHANRFELAGYYRANLNMQMAQVEGLLQTARDLEASGEKAQARRQCEAAVPLLARVRYAQDLLTVIDANATRENLQLQKTEQLYNSMVQMLARLAQAIHIYVESEESNFSRQTTLIENRIKSMLAQNGCSFVNNPTQADFHLFITATTRHHSDAHGFATCYADVEVNLVDTRRRRSVFRDEFSQKGVAATREQAGRRALEDAVPIVAEKILEMINR